MKTALFILIGLVVTVVIADFIYSRIVLARWAKWESTVKRDKEGIRLHCAPFAMGEGHAAILLVHGFADSPALYRKYAPVLAEQGYHCKAIRLPGWAVHMDEMRKVRLEDWQKTISDEVAALRESHDKVWVVAHSLGAALSMNLAIDGKLNADGLIAITPMVKVADTRSPVLSTEQWFRVSNALLHLSSTVESIFAVNMHDESMAGTLYRDTFVPRNIYSALYELMGSLKGRAEQLTLPTMIILAKDDLIIDTPAAESYFKRIGAASRKLVMVEDSGHVVPLDNDWEATVDLIHDFIQAEDVLSAE